MNELLEQYKAHGFIRGSQLLSINPSDLAQHVGYQCIHQSWKTENIPNQFKSYFDSWYMYHPDAVRVLWTDDDNDALVHQYYPEFEYTYTHLFLKIQQCDLVRLLYLHRYGGLYADLDYEAKQNVFVQFSPQQVMCVESPVLLNEVMQNSLMFSQYPNILYWYDCVNSIKEIVSFIKNPQQCYEHGWGGCDLINLFKNRMTKQMANLLFTVYMTGPAILDKTLARYIIHDQKIDIGIFPATRFFHGDVAVHHQANTWVNFTKPSSPFICVGVLGLIIVVSLTVLITWLVCRKNKT